MIVVGVDGSAAGLEAAGWAAKEAVLRGVPLRVVHAMPGWAITAGEHGRFAEVARWMREGSATVLDAAAERARREAPQVSLERESLPGDARPALISAAAQACLLVVGNHGIGGFRGLLVGSVAHGVAGHAPCDVVVVRESPALLSGEVAAGVDGSAASQAVLRFAFAEASLRRATLRVVHAWSSLEEGGGIVPVPDDAGEEKGGRRILEEVLAGWREQYPDVQVVEEVVHGHPVEVLLAAGKGADLLVIGSNGHGGLAGMVLGSVSQAVLHHAAGPVAVVRTGAAVAT